MQCPEISAVGKLCVFWMPREKPMGFSLGYASWIQGGVEDDVWCGEGSWGDCIWVPDGFQM